MMPLLFPSILKNNNSACNRTNGNGPIIIRQKLSGMETALAHLVANRRQLNSSAEKARVDIRRAAERHIATLHQHECKLLEEVEHLLRHEQQCVEEQLENVNQTIGACKIVMAKMPADANEMGWDQLFPAEFVQRINLFAEMEPDYATIMFSGAFPESLCHSDATFGQVSMEFAKNPTAQRVVKKVDNPPHYDKWLFSQCQRKRSSNSTSSSDDTALADEQPPNAGQIGAIRDRLTSTSLSVASFDVISAGGGGGAIDHFDSAVTPRTVHNNIFESFFNELNWLPMDHWLRATSAAVNCFKNGTALGGTTQKQPQQPKQHTVSSMANRCAAKNHQKPSRKRMATDGADCCDLLSNSTTNWAKADLASWLNASSKRLSSSSFPSVGSCGATVISAVLASPPEQWLLAPSKVQPPFSAPISEGFGAVHRQQPSPDAKTAAAAWHHQPLMMLNTNSKNVQQPFNNATKNAIPFNAIERTTHATKQLHSTENDESLISGQLNKLARLFEGKSFLKANNAEQPTNNMATAAAEEDALMKQFSYCSIKNEDDDKPIIGRCHGADNVMMMTQTMAVADDERQEEEEGKDGHHHHAIETNAFFYPTPPMDDHHHHNPKSKDEEALAFPLVKAKPPLALSNDPSHWLKRYPPPKQNRPMNEMAEDLCCWESVLGWKSILEKIHGSGEDGWLAPSSRAIKNSVPPIPQQIE